MSIKFILIVFVTLGSILSSGAEEYQGKVEEGIDGGWFFFWDTMAAVSAIRPEVMGSHEETISVTLEDGPSLGQARIDPDGISVRV